MSVDLPKIREFVEILKNTETKETIAIKLEKAQNLPLTTSKVGGLPFLAQDAEIPTNSEGQQLTLLAQINCEELPENDFYPKKWILQFWILCDDVYWLDFDNPLSNENKRVIYISDFSHGLSEDEVREKYKPYVEDFSIFEENSEFSLVFEKKVMTIPTENHKFEEILVKKWNEYFPENQIEYMYDLDEEIDEIYDALNTDEINHRIGGHPYFIESDPSEYEKRKQYSELLLQIDSDYENNIVWNEDDIATFFISKQDLENLNFENVFYRIYGLDS